MADRAGRAGMTLHFFLSLSVLLRFAEENREDVVHRMLVKCFVLQTKIVGKLFHFEEAFVPSNR